jgi:hypothetical protein
MLLFNWFSFTTRLVILSYTLLVSMSASAHTAAEPILCMWSEAAHTMILPDVKYQRKIHYFG